MNTHQPAHRAFALAILLGHHDELYFQRRDDKPDILFPGMISLFGGHREHRESFLECAQRELNEEVGLKPEPRRLRPLFEYESRYPDGHRVEAGIFVLSGVYIDPGRVREGSLLTLARRDLPPLIGQMTPATSFAIRTFLSLLFGRD